MSISNFFKDINNNLSSKRLALITALPFCNFGSIYLCLDLIQANHSELAVKMWESYLLTVCVFGGFVTTELFAKRFTKNGNLQVEKDNE